MVSQREECRTARPYGLLSAGRPELVSRSRLIERLNSGLHRKLTVVSAPAGFGKTTLVSEWVHKVGVHGDAPPHVAWLSLDEGDNDTSRFLAYLIAALRNIKADTGKGVLSALQSPQPPPAKTVLVSLINEVAAITPAPSTNSTPPPATGDAYDAAPSDPRH